MNLPRWTCKINTGIKSKGSSLNHVVKTLEFLDPTLPHPCGQANFDYSLIRALKWDTIHPYSSHSCKTSKIKVWGPKQDQNCGQRLLAVLQPLELWKCTVSHLKDWNKDQLDLAWYRMLHHVLQWLPFENGQSPFYVVNEVTMTGQKPSLRFC